MDHRHGERGEKNWVSGWRRRLNACRSPSTESIADLPSEQTTVTTSVIIGQGQSGANNSPASCALFRRSSSAGNGLINNNNNNASSTSTSEIISEWPTDDGEDTVVIPVRSLASGSPSRGRQTPGYCRNARSAAALAPYGQNTLPQVVRGPPPPPQPLVGPVRNTRNSPFCPCLSPNDSDDEGTFLREPANTSNQNRRQLGARQIISMARELRTRFVLAADATNQSPCPIRSSPNLGDGVMLAEPYPVHTSVEYTHYLVPELVNITNAPYYWGVMDRFEAERLLEGKPEGTFLLRDSAQIEYLFSVSFRRYSRTLHARIEQLNHRFSFDSYDSGVFSAETVTELIEHYSDPARCLLFEPQLSKPLNRTFVFPLQHICRAVVSAHLTYNDIQNLPVPKKFKDYLREYHYKQPVRVRNLEPTT